MWIHDFLSHRQQFVTVNITTSNEAQIKRDLPQGSVLGPFQFPIHMYDINNEITNSTLSCFDDDTRIRLRKKFEKYTQMSRNYLHKLYIGADANNMKFNASKFEFCDMVKNNKKD